MRILFIKSTLNSSSARADFGIASISAVLKKAGHNVDLFVFRDWDNISILEYRISQTKPDIIAFSVYASLFLGLVKVGKILKKKFPNIIQIMGGVHVILNPNDIEKAPSVDAVCTGDGEYALLQFIENYAKKDNSYLSTPGFWTRNGDVINKNPRTNLVQELDALPFPDREIFINQEMSYGGFTTDGKIYLDFMFTRGCPFPCPYCSNHALRKVYGFNKYVRRMSPKRAIEWLKHDLAIYAYDRVCIIDDTFTLDKKWVIEFLKLYKDEIPVPFVCLLRVGTFDEELIRLLKKSGCVRVTLGVESGDEEYRKKILKRGMPNQDIIDSFELIKKYKISVGAFVMIGLPGETPKMWLKTVKLLGALAPNKIVINTYYPYPGTELYEFSKKMGFISHKQQLKHIEGVETSLKMPNFNGRDILYYWHRVDYMAKLCRTENNFKKQILNKIIFNLYSIPPSSKLFFLTQTALYFYDQFCFLSKKLKNRIA